MSIRVILRLMMMMSIRVIFKFDNDEYKTNIKVDEDEYKTIIKVDDDDEYKSNLNVDDDV